MKIAGEYTFEAPPEKIWDGLMNPEVMAATMPGTERLELVGENQYQSDLNIKVGPVQGKFRGRIELENIDPPNGYTMKVDGQGPQGFVKATARIEIAAAGDGTRMTYDGDAHVGGRIATVGQRLVESAAKAIIKQRPGRLERYSEGSDRRRSCRWRHPGDPRDRRCLDDRVCRQSDQRGGQGSGADARLDRCRDPVATSHPLFHPEVIDSLRTPAEGGT